MKLRKIYLLKRLFINIPKALFLRIKNRLISGGTIEYLFGRFVFVRKIRTFYLRSFDKGKSLTGNNKIHIELIDQKKAILELKTKGVCLGLKLKEKTLNKFKLLISKSKTKEHGKLSRKFDIDSASEFNSGNPINPVLMIDHYGKDLNSFADEVAHSYPLFNIAEYYLGKVKKVRTKVQTSLVANASNNYRDTNGQTVTFHYDVEGYNFVYIFFYLTSCNYLSGAHESIFYSHKNKSLRFLFSSARKTDELIYKTYPGKDFIISGNPGFGFIEDTSCYHRALAPIKFNRTCFQIRYVS